MQADDAGTTAGFQLRDLLAILQMQWRVVVGCTVAAAVLALAHGLVATRMYRSTAVLHLSSTAGQELKVDRVVDVDQFNRWNRQIFVQTQLEILHSRHLLEAALRAYGEACRDDEALAHDEPVAARAACDAALLPDEAGVAALSSMLEVNPRQGTELLDLSIESDDPEKSALLANTVTRVYRNENLDGAKKDAREAKEWLQKQIEVYRLKIEDASTALIAYQGANNLADVDDQVNSNSARMDSLNQAYAEVNTQRVLQESRVWSHEKLLKEGAYKELAKDIDTPLVASLNGDYAAAASDQSRIAAKYEEKMPERRAADARLARIEQELRNEVEVTLSAERKKLDELYTQERKLQKEIDSGKEQMLGVSAQRPDYEKLKLDLQRNKEFFARLNQRNDELDLQSQTQLNNVRIIDEAMAVPRPVAPTVALNLVLALVAGFLGGLGVGLAREYLDDTISSPLEVQTFLRVPFLGMIPKIADETDETALALHTHRNPRSTAAEAMRAIRTVLELDPSGNAPKRLLITSAVSAEGKTSTIVRLGVAFANLDKKVLMIDADLRRPRLHKIFGVDKDVGLSSLIRGTPIEEAVRHTEVPNLDFLPSGIGGEHPNELLASAATERLLEELDKRYDLVLIDSPPTVLVSDAKILSRMVEGVVVLVREETTSRMLVREAVLGLEQVKARVLGVIVNGVDLSRRRTSYKYYNGYGYGYGYGYRYDRYYTDPAPDDADART